jgi:hypothetical protein
MKNTKNRSRIPPPFLYPEISLLELAVSRRASKLTTDTFLDPENSLFVASMFLKPKYPKLQPNDLKTCRTSRTANRFRSPGSKNRTKKRLENAKSKW